jgi:hypothetical protein
MKVNKIILGTALSGVIIGGLISLSNTKEAQYQPREARSVEGAQGYAEFMKMLRVNPATGELDYALIQKARREAVKILNKKNKVAMGINWSDIGPDNVGGRTRGFLIDKNNPNRFFAGSVSGGLWRSDDAGGNWYPVNDTICNEAVSCIAQTASGRIFFGTGAANFENPNGELGSGFVGSGLYEYDVATNTVIPVIQTSSVPNNSTTAPWSSVYELATYGDRIYAATNNGLKWAEPDANGNYPSTDAGWINPVHIVQGNPNLYTGAMKDVVVDKNGRVYAASSSNVYISPDGSDDSFSPVSLSGSSRIELAVSPSNPNIVYASTTKSNSCLNNIYRSDDYGQTWTVIGPGGGSFDPFANPGVNCQGWYDNTIAVNPSNPDEILVGGVHLYKWVRTPGTNPVAGQWTNIATTVDFGLGGNPYYVHADKHKIVYANASTIYVATDGGVFRSKDGGNTWTAINHNYNVTQFYDMAIAANGYVLGGSQDNGTQLVGALTTNPHSAIEISGGDGFECAFSDISQIAFATVYNGSLSRISMGGSSGSFFDGELESMCASGCGPFHTMFGYWENERDPFAKDTLWFKDTVNSYNVGDTIIYYSQTNGASGTPIALTYITPNQINSGDSIPVIDSVQSKLAFYAGSSSIYLTRDAIRLSNDPQWDLIASSINGFSGTPLDMKFSPDGNHLFVGTTSGNIYRISNLNNAYDSLTTDIRSSSSVITLTQIGGGTGQAVTGIAVDPNNSDNIIVTLGNYTSSAHVYRCTNATTAGMASNMTTNFTSIQGPSSPSADGYLPKMPVYDAEIDINDNNVVLIGTECGVWACQNAFTGSTTTVKWYPESQNDFMLAPVFTVTQQTKPWNKAVNSQEYYLGTHGRGFWKTSDLVGIRDIKNNTVNATNNLMVYPNPLQSTGTISFTLNENSDNVSIEIFDINGKLIKTDKLGRLLKGTFNHSINVSKMPNGTYFVKLNAGKQSKLSKVVVLK